MPKALIFAILCLFAPASFAEFVVSYRTPATSGSHYHDYYTKLIELALEKTRAKYGPYKMQGVPPSMSTLRSVGDAVADTYPNLLVELGYDQALTSTGKLTYIDFPIDGGIVGYRVCFVTPELKDKLKQVRNLDDLRKYTVGQGVGWADTEILRANGFKVMEIANYNSIFKMVIAGRVDFFCRGANQIQSELEEFKELDTLTYDESFALVYSLPRFFYLNSNNELAKKRITEGLIMAYRDGSLKKLWDQHYKSSVDFSKLHSRKIYRLENPLLKNLDRGYEKYFFDPLK